MIRLFVCALASLALTAPALADPAQHYQQHCAVCHGVDRLGGTGPANPGNIRFPANAVITNLNPAAVDRGIAIMAPDGVTVYELRGYNNNPAAPQASGLKIYDASGLGYDTGSNRWGFSASGVGNLFGLLRSHEMNEPANVVGHVLQLAFAVEHEHRQDQVFGPESGFTYQSARESVATQPPRAARRKGGQRSHDGLRHRAL